MRIDIDVYLPDNDKCSGCPLLTTISNAAMCGMGWRIGGEQMIVWRVEDATRPEKCKERYGNEQS